MDVGNTRACLNGTTCPQWPRFQAALAAAGPLILDWRVQPEAAADGAGADPQPGAQASDVSTPERAVVAARQRLLLDDTAGVSELLSGWVEREQGLTRPQVLMILPVMARVGAGRVAMGVLGRESWAGADPALDVLVRLAVQLGPALAVAAAEPLVQSYNACDAVPLAEGFRAAGSTWEAALLARLIRRQDPSCWPAFELEARAWERLDRAGSIGTVYNAAKVAFPEDAGRLDALGARTFVVRGELSPALYLLEKRVDGGDLDSWSVGALLDLYAHPDLRASRKVAFQTRLERDAGDAKAAAFAGSIAFAEGRYREAFALFDRATAAEPRLARVARLKTLQALAAAELGDRRAAREAQAAAERLDPEDPRVLVARGEVWRDERPVFARRGLEAALRAMSDRASMSSLRQSTVERLAAAKACADRATPGPCPGPWAHVFGAASRPAPPRADDPNPVAGPGAAEPQPTLEQ